MNTETETEKVVFKYDGQMVTGTPTDRDWLIDQQRACRRIKRNLRRNRDRALARHLDDPRCPVIQKRLIQHVTSAAMTAGSHHRTPELIHVLELCDSEVFWPLFLDMWPVMENAGAYNAWLCDMLRARHEIDHFSNYAEPEDRAFYDSLPNEFEVFRGSGDFNVKAFSWTLDRKTAEFFACYHRFAGYKTRLVSTARIRKRDVFFVFDGTEKEIGLDPKKLRGLKSEEVTPDWDRCAPSAHIAQLAMNETVS
ncbi:MAG TPA: hypothetical protein VHT68_20955 [Pseudolabrys sp.]|jgi:hypothetical protein|nr:hypothetical protein [Pseudolabrys sp.]